jgi:hypothetical protein
MGQGLKKLPIRQKLDFANHPYLCKGLTVLKKSGIFTQFYQKISKGGNMFYKLNVLMLAVVFLSSCSNIVQLKKEAHNQNFSPTWRFFKPSLSPAKTRFKEITN